MSGRRIYSHSELQRISDRKKRKLAIDVCDEMSIDSPIITSSMINSQIEIIEDSQSSLKGYRDLFGELIPNKCTDKCTPVSKKKKPESNKKKPESNRKKPESNRKKQTHENLSMDSPINRPTKMFIPTPQIIKIMKDAQIELYSLMGLNKSSSDVSVVSSNNLNVSGIQNLQNSPKPTVQQGEKPETDFIDNTKEISQIFDGIFVFVDYKFYNDRSAEALIKRLTEMGAKVEKTFNLKVTHVVFCDGYRRTYDKAIERNIPLVSARWIENSRLAKRILDPNEYPPVDIEKYTKAPKDNFKFPVSSTKYKKFLKQSNIDRDEMIKAKCEELYKRVKALNKDSSNETEENCVVIEMPEVSETIKETNCPSKTNDIISALSDQLCKVLNTNDSPMPDDKLDELYLPMSIKLLRKYLTPKEKENKSSVELDSDLVKIEDRLNLNSQARQRLRKLLFPSDKKLYNMSIVSDFPSPSPQKLRISAPARLISTNKRKILFNGEVLSQNKKVINNEKTPQKNTVKDNVLQWRIPTDLRPIKPKKINNQKEKNVKNTLTQETISILSRNSSMIFQTPKNSLTSSITLQTIACTGMTKWEVNIIKQSVQNLGTFTVQSKVEPLTTYLITKSQPNRTLNMVFAMAYGCYIVSENWVHESHKIGNWLSHKQYLISDLSEPVKEFQIRRHTFGPMLKFHIFNDAGRIYISDACEPSPKHLKQLVRACGGRCTSSETIANVVIGYTCRMRNNINEKWILDCITQGSLLNKKNYILVNNTIAKQN